MATAPALVAVALAVTLLAGCGSGSGSGGTDSGDPYSDQSGAAPAADAREGEEPAGTGQAEAASEPAAGDEAERAAEPAAGDEAERAADPRFPDVIDAVATRDTDGTWTFSVTLSSPYDSPQRYADAWRVVGADGTVYGVRALVHDHAAEQPFTRSQSAVAIPDDVESVTIEGRDLANGWGGTTLAIDLER
jgi:hypothetical protein